MELNDSQKSYKCVLNILCVILGIHNCILQSKHRAVWTHTTQMHRAKTCINTLICKSIFTNLFIFTFKKVPVQLSKDSCDFLFIQISGNTCAPVTWSSCHMCSQGAGVLRLFSHYQFGTDAQMWNICFPWNNPGIQRRLECPSFPLALELSLDLWICAKLCKD